MSKKDSTIKSANSASYTGLANNTSWNNKPVSYTTRPTNTSVFYCIKY